MHFDIEANIMLSHVVHALVWRNYLMSTPITFLLLLQILLLLYYSYEFSIPVVSGSFSLKGSKSSQVFRNFLCILVDLTMLSSG